MPPIPKTLKLHEVPPYIKAKFGLKVSRQTVTSWVKKGVKNETLRSRKIATQLGRGFGRWPEVTVTTELWVNEFIQRTYSHLLTGQVAAEPDSPGIPVRSFLPNIVE
jgi:hypothetical protein